MVADVLRGMTFTSSLVWFSRTPGGPGGSLTLSSNPEMPIKGFSL